MSLLSTPTAAQSPSAISSGTLAQSSSTSKVHSPSPSRSAIVSSRSCSTIIGRACWTGESPPLQVEGSNHVRTRQQHERGADETDDDQGGADREQQRAAG